MERLLPIDYIKIVLKLMKNTWKGHCHTKSHKDVQTKPYQNLAVQLDGTLSKRPKK